MVCTASFLFGVVVVLFTIIETGTSLKCYDCSNLLDKKCGVSFDFSGTEGDKYIKECEGQTVACRKIETKDTFKAEVVVIRSCWNSSGVEDLDEDFLDCNKMASIGKACYCNKDLDSGKPCNDGHYLKNSFLTLLMTVVVAALAFIM